MRTPREIVTEALEHGRTQTNTRDARNAGAKPALARPLPHNVVHVYEGVLMSEKTEAEAGAKATAEALIKTAKEAAEASAEAEVDEVQAEVVTAQHAAEAAAIKADPAAANVTAEAASVKANEELREKNAKILSLTSK